jgi:autoinducer 2-degrading protein
VNELAKRKAAAMYQFLVSFTTHATGPFFAEASAYAEGPTWLMKGNVAA